MEHSGDSPDTAARLRALPTRLLSLVAMHTDRMTTDRLAEVGARKWHFAVLTTLAEAGPSSQAELSRRTGIYRSDLVAVINELATQGHVERTLDPADRRRNVITMTAQGAAHLRRLDDIVTALEDAALAPLTTPERAQFLTYLTRLLDHHTAPQP